MREYELEVLEQYAIEVSSTRKMRGAFFCETSQGGLLLEAMNFSATRAAMIQKLAEHLRMQGFENIDDFIVTKEGLCYSTLKDGTKYVLKRWFTGRECEVKKEGDVLAAVQNLAKLHQVMYWEDEESLPFAGQDLTGEYRGHNLELKKIRTYVRSRVSKNEFEWLFLHNYERIESQAEAVSERLAASQYERLSQSSRERRTLVHGDYNYHNVLMLSPGAATTNFQHFRMDVQAADLYYFMRKVLEKNRWNESLGARMLRSYEVIHPLTAEEKEYLAIRLAYPEKVWKIMNSYYHSNKAWIPEKNLSKLKVTLLQSEEKRRFLEHIFSFFL